MYLIDNISFYYKEHYFISIIIIVNYYF